jgi:hypothetical protein
MAPPVADFFFPCMHGLLAWRAGMEHHEEESFEITDPVELQASKPQPESLFDNFSDLSIEFG